jgi:type IV fimbrial biogenesis protein FimT
MRTMKRAAYSGFTLIELMVTIAVLVILVVLAVPSFVDNLDRRRIVDAAEGIAKQVQQARMAAIQANRPIAIVFDTTEAEWCFGLTDQAACDCRQADACQIPFSHDLTITASTYQTVVGTRTQYSDVALAAAPASLRFEPRRGVRSDTGAPTESIVLTSARGREARVMVNIIGRAATCSPVGSTNVNGMRPCP